MWRVLFCLWVLTLSVLHHCTAIDEDFCIRPANMDLCWWNNNYKRYLRFGRGDPFLRFGRSKPESWRSNPFNHFGKRDDDPDSLEKLLENGGYLRFGRSVPQAPGTPLLALAIRKRRDVRSAPESPELERVARSLKEGGFLRFGRPKSLVNAGQGSPSPQTKATPDKRADAVNLDLPNGDREYLRFGRSHFDRFPGFGKRTYLRFGRTSPEGYLRFGKRSA